MYIIYIVISSIQAFWRFSPAHGDEGEERRRCRGYVSRGIYLHYKSWALASPLSILFFKHVQLLAGGANMDIKNAASETPDQIAKSRSQKNLSRSLQKHRLKDKVPSSAGFIAPWFQIFSAAYLTSVFGWFVGCAAFFPACGLLGVIIALTKGTERNGSHGFSAGSMFFIVGSFFYYLIDEVNNSPLPPILSVHFADFSF